MYFHILLCVPALYAGTRLMNKMSASRRERALPLRYTVVYFQFMLYASWLDLNVFYVGLVMCRHQRPLFDSAAVRNPASCVTTQDFVKFWGKNFAFVLLEMIENSQGFKTF
jgi:hypothetical protein